MKIKKFIQSKFFLAIVIILALHILTYPSIHHIVDEYTYLGSSSKICELNFSDFFGEKTLEEIEYYTHNTPLYSVIFCLTSPIHNFNVERAGLVIFAFLIATVIGWYYSIPKDWKIDKKKFVLLLLSNSLLWVYCWRALKDVPLAFFLSLGVFHLYLHFERKKIKNYYIAFILLSIALLLKESSILYIPIFFTYFLIKKVHNLKKWALLILPIIPYLVFTLLQYMSGFPVYWLFTSSFRATSELIYPELIPYARLPTVIFMIGIFGPGFISIVLRWKDSLFRKSEFNDFLKFFLIFYIIWELVFDFVLFGNMPRYHTILMPFLSLIIAESAEKTKNLKILFYLTLVYSIISGFAISYYFHVESLEIWRTSLREIIEKILGR